MRSFRKLFWRLRLSLFILRTGYDIDPMSQNYCGHNHARRLGVDCCCKTSIIDCPWHGR